MAADFESKRFQRQGRARALSRRDENCLELIGPCDCRTAVVRAYHGMLESGTAQTVAMGVATRVYLYHHPAVAVDLAQVTVERWVSAEALH